MIRFSVYNKGRPVEKLDLSGAYLVGGDGVPVRAELEFKNGEIRCRKKTAGPAALTLLWPVENIGRVLSETARVAERDQPYVLQLELARGRLMRLTQKREDWSADDLPEAAETVHAIDQSRDLLIQALKADSPPQAADLGQQSLNQAAKAGDALNARITAATFGRRRQTGSFTRRVLGVTVDGRPPTEPYCRRLLPVCDFAALPFTWRLIEPEEQRLDWSVLDAWVEWLARHRIPIRGCDLVCFSESSLPDWVFIYEHDFEAIRDLIYEHVRRVISRYASQVTAWDVVSGIHAYNLLSFSFEELMELTRMSTAIARQLAPRSPLMIDLTAPWGEYYARNQRTIPPLLYAEMILQSGIQFDAFGLRIQFGGAKDGLYVRDMFQLSAMIDRFNLGKPLHLSAVGVPSAGKSDGEGNQEGGDWQGAWSEERQRDWLKAFYPMALAKSFVDTVTWRPLCDRDSHLVAHCGLLRADLAPKPVYEEMLGLRNALGRSPAKQSTPK